MLILSMLIIIIIMVHQIYKAAMFPLNFFSSLKILSSLNIFSWGKVQTAALSGVVSPVSLEEFKQNVKRHSVVML